ncbi:hypothetical protein [Pseudovibrio denitrificans]|uniref:hypothetical protein n=1 Tax=Pseudovibrio denitrificans TaxID=258256 RepID=UPI000AA89CAD|nr:hypothetical protein [Pseudovibrio denitrificans]
MTEILFSQNDRYTNVIARLEAAISGKSVQDARVSLTKSASKNGEVLYKATVSQDNKDGLSEKVLGLCRAVTRHTRFLQNKAERPEQKVSNWNVFYQLLRNEAAQSFMSMHASSGRIDLRRLSVIFLSLSMRKKRAIQEV